MSEEWKTKLVEEISDLKAQRRQLINRLAECHVLFKVAGARFAGYALSVNCADPRNDEILESITEGEELTEEFYRVPGGMITDELLLTMVKQVMVENPKSVEDYKSGVPSAALFLLGQVMRLGKGMADGKAVAKLIDDEIGAQE